MYGATYSEKIIRCLSAVHGFTQFNFNNNTSNMKYAYANWLHSLHDDNENGNFKRTQDSLQIDLHVTARIARFEISQVAP